MLAVLQGHPANIAAMVFSFNLKILLRQTKVYQKKHIVFFGSVKNNVMFYTQKIK
ncbi:hypothetical protein BDD43_2361 [Mucilaginibacter gracilis]|uniref:Uncharacterized protein n=1 Tax=Mucilaginibacter gracilis TaxID=423350 RepID=A0A495IZQ3_9SPHI|nr:hypothetical protein BDD43_2361 [Mucilaginibacter gracilis]